MRIQLLSVLLLAAAPASALATAPSGPPPSPAAKTRPPQHEAKRLTVKSTAFAANQAIPVDYTCDGASTAPPLSWSPPPKDARSIAVFVDDPDAPGGTFTHWLVADIPPTATTLPTGGALPAGATAAKNGKGDVGYAGPCPPTGRHHYHFHVYALDTTIPTPASKDEFQSAIEGHVLATGELVATYQRVSGAQGTAPSPSAPK